MVPTFPVCMNSFLISFCPFTVSSSSFRVFTFRVFKEFLRDFRCLLLDLELRNRGGGGAECVLEHVGAPQGQEASTCHSHSAYIEVLWGKSATPQPPLHSKKQRKGWEYPGVHSLGKSPQREREWSSGNMDVPRAASWQDDQPATECSMKAVLSFCG